jgi:hypothetical protein
MSRLDTSEYNHNVESRVPEEESKDKQQPPGTMTPTDLKVLILLSVYSSFKQLWMVCFFINLYSYYAVRMCDIRMYLCLTHLDVAICYERKATILKVGSCDWSLIGKTGAQSYLYFIL